MKIVDAGKMTGRGEALITDEVCTPHILASASKKNKITVPVANGSIELAIIGVEVARKSGGLAFLTFVVPTFADEATRTLIINREIQLT